MPNAHTKYNRKLANIRLQLKSGKTRSANHPRNLTRDEISFLEKGRDWLQCQIQKAAAERPIVRINSNTSTAASAAADRVVDSQKHANDQIEAIASIYVDGNIP